MRDFKCILKRVSWGLALLVMVVACDKGSSGGSDSWKNPYTPDNPDVPVPDPEGTVLVAVRNSNNGKTEILPNGCYTFFYIKNDNFCGNIDFYSGSSYSWTGSFWDFAIYSQVLSLGNITKIPTSGWARQVAIIPGYGYVGRCIHYYTDGGIAEERRDTTYVRIYVTEYMTTSGGGVMGAYVKYQSPFVP